MTFAGNSNGRHLATVLFFSKVHPQDNKTIYEWPEFNLECFYSTMGQFGINEMSSTT